MFSFPDASRILNAEIHLPRPSFFIAGASIDSRSIQPGEIFVALPGEKVDGHAFLDSAFLKGASGAIISKKYFEQNHKQLENAADRFQNLIAVDVVLSALSSLAAWWRQRCSAKVIGITGSVGKTSTKEFLSYLLKQNYPVLATQGNFNNHIGLPLTLFRLHQADRFCVAELGANHVGEIRHLSTILKPDAAIITQIAPAHLEGFGSLEAIYEAKLELFESLAPGSIAIIPDDNPTLYMKAKRFPVKLVTVGMSASADYQISQVSTGNGAVSFTLNGKRNYRFPSSAGFLVCNAAMAIAMAELICETGENIPAEWNELKLPDGRFQAMDINQITVIFDGYNANPSSFEGAIDQFERMPIKGQKYLVISDMLELGNLSRHYHEELGRKIAARQFQRVLAYGTESRFTIHRIHELNPEMRAGYYADPELVGKYLKNNLRQGDAVLMKASRGMRIEKILESIKQDPVPLTEKVH